MSSLCTITIETEDGTIFMLKNYLGQDEQLRLVKDIGSSVNNGVQEWNTIRSLREQVTTLKEATKDGTQ